MPEGRELQPCYGRRPQPSRRVVAIRKMIVDNADVLDRMPEQFGALYQSAYEAGYGRLHYIHGDTDTIQAWIADCQPGNNRCQRNCACENSVGCCPCVV